MRCRAIRNGRLIWFNSYGKNLEGKSIKFPEYDDYIEGIVSDLIQRLSVIKEELWFAETYGVPLTEKIKSRAILDIRISDIIMQCPDVVDILSLESNTDGYTYSCNVTILTIYGSASFSV